MQWQYKVFRELPEEELNDIGGEGWEVISATFAEEDGILLDVLAKRGLGGRGRGGGRGGGGHGRKKGPRIGVMGGTAIGEDPGY